MGNELEKVQAIEEIVQGTVSAFSGMQKLAHALQQELGAVREKEAAAGTELAVYREKAHVLERIAGHVEHFGALVENTMSPEVRAQVAGLENPMERYVVAAGRMIETEVLVSHREAAALRRAAWQRVDEHLSRHPELRPLRAALLQRLALRVWREFGGRHGYLVPKAAKERVERYLETFPLPEPALMRPLQMELVRARGQMGVDTGVAARAIGVTRSTYVRWEMGDAQPLPRYERAISAFLQGQAGLAGGQVVSPAGYERAAGARHLADLRRRAGLTQREAAARVGIPSYTVGRLEQGRAVRGGRVLEAQLLAMYRDLLNGGEVAAGS